MKILAIIPARLGSKGVPDKNIKLLNGKPLVGYTIETAKLIEFSRIILSTESAKIAEVGIKAGIDVPFLRPKHLAQDTTPTIDVVIDLLHKLMAEDEHYDAICLLQPTTPFRNLTFVNECLYKFQTGNFDSLISVQTVPDHFNPSWVFIDKDINTLKIATGESKIISRRQELPPAYIRDGSVYLARTYVVLNERSLYGSRIGYVLNQDANHVNIDNASDWEQAEIIAKKLTQTE